MAEQSLRGMIAALDASGQLHRVTRRVDPRFELGAVLSLRDRGPALLFENVGDGAMPVIGNVLNSRARFALALGATEKDLDDRCREALTRPKLPVLIDSAPVQDIIVERGVDLPALLPVPTWFERETAPYITAGVIVAKDPETGRRNVSIARLRLEGGSRIMAGIAKNHHLFIIAEKAKALGQMLEDRRRDRQSSRRAARLAVLSRPRRGRIPQYRRPAGRAVQLVRCKTVDLEVPAQAEIALEGTLDPSDLIDEGPVSEFHGFYVDYGFGMAGSVRCVTRRRDAIYQAILPGWASEHCLLGAVAIATTLRHALQRMIPAVRRVLITEGGMGRLHAVISMHRPRLGEGKRAILLAMGQVNLLKLVTVVEDDVDIENPREVEWSLAARFRGHEDLMVIPASKPTGATRSTII